MNKQELHERFESKRMDYCQRAERSGLVLGRVYELQAARMARLVFLLTADPADIYIATKKSEGGR